MDSGNAMEIAAFEAAVEAAADGAALWEAWAAFCRSRGVTRLTYHHLPPFGAPDAQAVRFRAEGFPEDVVARYAAARMWRENPMLAEARSSPEPVYWSAVLAEARLSPEAAALLDALGPEGPGEGLGVPVFGPNGRNGYCGLGLGPGRAPLPPGEVRDLQWACQLAHLRACSLIAERMGAPPDLSPRESEVLDWVARGKSNAVIADILGISAHTVDAHLRRVFLKLDVGDRISATVRALGFGLIHAEA